MGCADSRGTRATGTIRGRGNSGDGELGKHWKRNGRTEDELTKRLDSQVCVALIRNEASLEEIDIAALRERSRNGESRTSIVGQKVWFLPKETHYESLKAGHTPFHGVHRER
jgi:hypothetical protein